LRPPLHSATPVWPRLPHFSTNSTGRSGSTFAIALGMTIEFFVLLAGVAFLVWMLFVFFEWRARTLRSVMRRKRGRV
jgi:hypothetical protein